MKCEKCNQNEATYFYEENINGKVSSYHLCASCASKMDNSEEMPFFSAKNQSFIGSSLFQNLIGGVFSGGGTAAPTRKTCTGCSATWGEIKQNGMVFCPQCYETFREELSETLRRMHGNLVHVGRRPDKKTACELPKKEPPKKSKLNVLREELAEMIKTENFERAAKLRDEIKALEATEKKEEA